LARDPDLTVRVVVDDDNCGPGSCVIDEITPADRVTVVRDDRSGLMHHKWVIADGARLWVGSANWTERSFCVDHNDALVIEQPEIVARYREIFERMATEGTFGPVAPEEPTTAGAYTVYFSPESPTTMAPAWLTAMVAVYLGLALLLHLVLKHTMIGRSVYAYGADPEAAKRVGFSTGRTMIFVYVTAGALAGFSGLLHSSMIWLANPRDFVGLELDVIAAVVLGGASIFGGRGTVLGTVLGVFILVMIQNSLILMGIDTTWQRVVVGGMLIAAVTVTALRDRRALV
ncbi:MAG: hypothetical protein CL813_00585, partial [Confluentimicrobium sp.]|nr:hypothetical protein [Actibacterium sp.]